MCFYLLKRKPRLKRTISEGKFFCVRSATTSKEPSQALKQCVLDRHDPSH
jgi:hypothetical protein